MDLFTVENILALLTLTLLEIVLGIDNIIFISILVEGVEEKRRDLARKVGLLLAMGMRIVFLMLISWIMLLTTPLFTFLDHPFSGRDLILLFGGLFLIGKATFEIHDKMELGDEAAPEKKRRSFTSALVQIVLLDIVFSIDSVLTAIGMANDVRIMIVAVVIAVLTMMLFAKTVGEFINRHPTFKILALSFLLLIGVMLTAEGFGKHIEKGYIYFAIGFSVFVEALNTRFRRKGGDHAAHQPQPA